MPETEPSVETDEFLLQKAGRGDAEAFGKLYDRLAPPLFGLMRRMLGDDKEAEDSLQEGFVYLWQKASSFDPDRSEAFTWSVMIFRNKAIDRLRARARQDSVAEVAAQQPAVEKRSTPAGEDGVESRERAALLRKALAAIPDEQRELIETAFFHGETHEGIAQRLKLPLGTVKTKIRSGLLRLRELLKGGGA